MKRRILSSVLGALLLAASLHSSSCSSFLADAQTAEQFVAGAAALAPTVIDAVQSHLVTACRQAGVNASQAAQAAQKAIGQPNEKTTAAASSAAQTRMVSVCKAAGVSPQPLVSANPDMSAPASTSPTAPAPTAPAPTAPASTAPASTSPTAPASTSPTAPASTSPTAPASTSPTAPASTSPTAPAGSH